MKKKILGKFFKSKLTGFLDFGGTFGERGGLLVSFVSSSEDKLDGDRTWTEWHLVLGDFDVELNVCRLITPSKDSSKDFLLSDLGLPESESWG